MVGTPIPIIALKKITCRLTTPSYTSRKHWEGKKMTKNGILMLSTIGLLAACGGSSDGSAVNPIASAPTAVRKIALNDQNNLESVIQQIDSAQNGDYFDIPSTTLYGEDGELESVVRIVVVDDLAGAKKLLYSSEELGAGNRDIFFVTEGGLGLLQGDILDVSFTELDSSEERNIFIETSTNTDGYRGIEIYVDSDVDYADASLYQISSEGRTFFIGSASASSSDFSLPAGEFNYGGRAALVWDDGNKLAVGDIRMTARFANTSSTATIQADNLVGYGTTAAFSGNVAIDNATGTYASTSASITTNGTSVNAGILGIFNGDATRTAGTIFDASTSGEQAAGVFSMSRD
jgi:hypothetical protein